jgi:hypothetical protein
MSGTQRGEWRVVGESDDGARLLLKPLFDADLPDAVRVGDCAVVTTDGYGGPLQDVVDELRPGYLVYAAVYAGRTGRFVEAEVADRMRLSVGHDVESVPSIAVDLWNRAVAERDDDDPVAASLPFEASGGHAELNVVQSTNARPDDVWWAFVGGDGGETIYGSFEFVDGRPAEAVAGNPRGRPFFYVMTFEEGDTRPATQLRESFTGLSMEDLNEMVSDALAGTGFDADVSVSP